MIGWLLAATLVLAQESGDPTADAEPPRTAEPAPAEAPPAAPAPADSPPDRANIEVIVYEEMRVEQARQQVYSDLQDAGYSEFVRKEDKAIFRHPDPWKGEVHVHDDGWMRVKRQKVQMEGREMPWAEKNSPLAWAGCVVWLPLCVRPAGQTTAKRKYRDHEDRVVRWAQEDVNEWGERIADLAVMRKVEGLPARLEALWAEGTPIDGEGPALATPAERRAHLMQYWGSRTDTVWGEQVRASVESFCRGVVQHSEHPFTEAEIEAFNRTLPEHVRPFSLERPPVADGE